MSCVFRHFSQYKYIMLIPKQPAHFLPKSGHNSATFYDFIVFKNASARAGLEIRSSTM